MRFALHVAWWSNLEMPTQHAEVPIRTAYDCVRDLQMFYVLFVTSATKKDPVTLVWKYRMNLADKNWKLYTSKWRFLPVWFCSCLRIHFCWNCEITDSFASQVQWYILIPVFCVSFLCFSMLLHRHLYLEWGYPQNEEGSRKLWAASKNILYGLAFGLRGKGCWPINRLFLNAGPMIRFVFVFCVLAFHTRNRYQRPGTEMLSGAVLMSPESGGHGRGVNLGWPRVRASQEIANCREILPNI